jgi:hypothetical protein
MKDVATTAGMNRVAWDLRHDAAWQPSRADSARLRGGDSTRADSAGGGTVDRGQQERYLPPARGRGVARIDSTARGDTRILTDSVARGRGEREEEDEESRFRRPGAPFAVPGAYTVSLKLPGQTLSKSVQVRMDPRIEISTADLQAQLVAGLQARELESRVNRMVFRTNDLIRQLGALEGQLRQSAPSTTGTSGDGAAGPATDARLAQVSGARRKLTQLRDSLMARPIPNLGYRQYPRLREEVGTIARMIAAVHAKPTDAQLRRYAELVQEAQRVDGMLNAIVGDEIAKINAMMRASPRIFADRAMIM